jgi:glycosyltransferase involved in cell wall biosynthesis
VPVRIRVPRRRLNLLVSTRTFLPLVGGAEVGIHEIYKRIATEHDVTVLTRPHPPRVLQESGEPEARPAGYDVVHVLPWADPLPWQVSHYARLLGVPVAAAVARLHRRRPIDAYNAHFVRPHLLPLRVARRLGVRTVLSLVGRDDVMRDLPRPRAAYMRATCAAADLVVPNSEVYLQGARLGGAIQVIPYGVDLETFSATRSREKAREALGLRREAFVLLAVQRLVAVKHVDQLIRALPRVREQISDLQLVLVGRGPEESALRDLAEQLDASDAMRFAGHVPEDMLPLYFQAADCLVSHSTAETFGIVFAQAMAAGLPIVAARAREAAPPGDAMLFEPFDLEELATALAAVAREPAGTEAGVERNRSYAQRHFDWDAIAENYLRALSGDANG